MFACVARKGEFYVVDCGSAVHGNRSQDSSVEPVDEIRPASGFDDMTADGGNNWSFVSARPAQCVAPLTKLVACQDLWK
jgi:hypothetical protein